MLPDERWIVTEHVCRRCLGAILELAGAEVKSRKTFMCAVCGTRVAGAVEDLCGCGLVTRDGARVGKRLPFRCVPNPQPSASNPSRYVIGFAVQQAEEVTA